MKISNSSEFKRLIIDPILDSPYISIEEKAKFVRDTIEISMKAHNIKIIELLEFLYFLRLCKYDKDYKKQIVSDLFLEKLNYVIKHEVISEGDNDNLFVQSDIHTLSIMRVILKHDLYESLELMLKKDPPTCKKENRLSCKPFRSSEDYPIIYAAMYNAVKCTDILIQYGADIDTIGAEPVVFEAAYRNSLSVLNLLIQRGANLHARSVSLGGHNLSILDFALQGRSYDSYLYLINHFKAIEDKQFHNTEIYLSNIENIIKEADISRKSLAVIRSIFNNIDKIDVDSLLDSWDKYKPLLSADYAKGCLMLRFLFGKLDMNNINAGQWTSINSLLSNFISDFYIGKEVDPSNFGDILSIIMIKIYGGQHIYKFNHKILYAFYNNILVFNTKSSLENHSKIVNNFMGRTDLINKIEMTKTLHQDLGITDSGKSIYEAIILPIAILENYYGVGRNSDNSLHISREKLKKIIPEILKLRLISKNPWENLNIPNEIKIIILSKVIGQDTKFVEFIYKYFLPRLHSNYLLGNFNNDQLFRSWIMAYNDFANKDQNKTSYDFNTKRLSDLRFLDERFSSYIRLLA